jgi:uncharacterized protein (DUF433 family)
MDAAQGLAEKDLNGLNELRGQFQLESAKEPAQSSSQMPISAEHRYLITDDQILGGEPIIRETRTPVRAVVELWRLGVAPEEIPTRLPHLSLAQVFDALSDYSDHQEQIQKHIERNRKDTVDTQSR